jgi:hypothetical protein
MAAIGAGIVVLLLMQLRGGGGSFLLDPTLVGIAASGVAFVLTFWLRRSRLEAQRGPSDTGRTT